MKSLTILQTVIPSSQTTTPPPWHLQTHRPFHHQTRPEESQPTSWRLHSGGGGAKGFAPKPKQTPPRKRRKDDDDDDDKLPEVVFERMISRILFSVGVPLLTGFASLQIIGVVKERGLWEVPKWVPFLAIFVAFGASALGIAYGSLSTSLDGDKEGSFLGFEQFQKNWDEMWKEEDEVEEVDRQDY